MKNGKSSLHIDHRHDNGAVRGMLCVLCNSRIGVLDLRYTDPDFWRVLLAWSDREAPVVPVRGARRGRTVRTLTLFD